MSLNDEKSLLNAIYDRYGEVNESDLQDFISFSSDSSSSSSSSSPVSSSSSSSDSNNNTILSNKLQQQSEISFYLPSKYGFSSARKAHIKTSISIVLSNHGIDHIGDLIELESICTNVLELDLSKNEFKDLIEIKSLLLALKKLRLLNLSSNKFNKSNLILNNSLWPLTQHFEQLNTLILNSCYLDLNLVVEFILERLPNLNELHLASNNYAKINFNKNFIKKSIRILYFNNNLLKDWSDVCKLGKSFPNLENLVLSENNIENFKIFDQNETNSNLFKNLKILILNKLKINNWHSIDQLREFPKLKHVRIQNIPLLESLTDEEKYYVLVGHLDDSIDSLNGSKITNDDKENCERKYIRYFMDLSIKPDRYYELESKHGKLDPLADVNMGIRKRVHVKIKYNEKQYYDKIDVRQTVGEFKKYLEKFVGLPSNRFKVFYIDIEACSMAIYGPEELKHTNRCLYSFNIRDDDEFEIDLKPAPVLTSTNSEYQFQYQHLHHLHHHHYNSHVNNNSHFQIPVNLNIINRTKNRKLQTENSVSFNLNNNNNSLKRSKPGLVTSPRLINKSKDLTKNKSNQNKVNQICCAASLPANLNNLKNDDYLKNEKNENKMCEPKVVFTTTTNEND